MIFTFAGHFLVDMIELLEKTFYHNTIQEWAISFAIILGAIVAAKALYWVIGRTVKKLAANTKTKLDDILVDTLEEPIVFAIAIVGLWYGFDRLSFPEVFQNWMGKVFHVLIAINITWLLARLIDALIREYLVPITEKSESDLDDQLMPILRKGIRTAIWILGIIVALNNAGYNVGALLAGLGIGGLALAMAAKDFVANIFGGVSVFVDKPFMVNDRIKIDGFDGVVKEIGIRSTRISTLEGRMLTVPNHKFTDSIVENVSIEPTRKVVLNLGLTYDTSPENIQKAIGILNEIWKSNQELIDENKLISFNSFGDFNLGILFIYYIRKEADIFETQSKMNLQILDCFNKEGLEFAFPTQTIHTQSSN